MKMHLSFYDSNNICLCLLTYCVFHFYVYLFCINILKNNKRLSTEIIVHFVFGYYLLKLKNSESFDPIFLTFFLIRRINAKNFSRIYAPYCLSSFCRFSKKPFSVSPIVTSSIKSISVGNVD